MAYRVDLSELAHSDIENAIAWLKQRSETAADRFNKAVLSAIDSLEQMPRRCPIAPETRSFLIEIRHLIFGDGALQFRIIFGVSVEEISGEGVVTIYRVRNSSQ